MSHRLLLLSLIAASAIAADDPAGSKSHWGMTDQSIGLVLTIAVSALVIALALAYVMAPFMLYGIYARLGQLIDIEENAARQLAHIRALQTPAPADVGFSHVYRTRTSTERLNSSR